MALVIRVRAGEQAKKLARRLMHHARLIVCSGCGQRDFGLVEQPDQGYRTVLERQDVGHHRHGREAVAQPLVTLICTHCGHVEQFAEAVLNGAAPAEYGDAVDE